MMGLIHQVVSASEDFYALVVPKFDRMRYPPKLDSGTGSLVDRLSKPEQGPIVEP